MGKLIDLTGQTFGTLTVIERDYDNQKGGHAYWRCKCECGREVTIEGYRLRSGNTKTCGYFPCSNSFSKGNDITGQQFNYWTVLKRVQSSNDGHSQYLCKCKCGNEKIVLRKTLINGSSRSCGCFKNELTSQRFSKIIPSGSQFGELTVLSVQLASNQFKRKLYKCKCSCGKEIIVPGNALRSGNTTSCGHIKSRGETTIAKLLDNYKINYQTQWNNDGQMLLSSGYPCRFDFAIFPNKNKQTPLFLIEYNGIQHYKTSNSGWDTDENLKCTQQRDKEKITLCQINDIPLEIIPYTDFNCLETIIPHLLQKYKLISI